MDDLIFFIYCRLGRLTPIQKFLQFELHILKQRTDEGNKRTTNHCSGTSLEGQVWIKEIYSWERSS